MLICNIEHFKESYEFEYYFNLQKLRRFNCQQLKRAHLLAEFF